MTILNLHDFQNYTQLASDLAWEKEKELFSDLEDLHGEDLDKDLYMGEVQEQVAEYLKEYFKTEIKEWLEDDSCYSDEQIEVIESFFM